jgi:hypothetical protein
VSRNVVPGVSEVFPRGVADLAGSGLPQIEVAQPQGFHFLDRATGDNLLATAPAAA